MDRKIENPHILEQEKIKEALVTDFDKGLSTKEAKKRLEKFGGNNLDAGETVSPLKILFQNINNVIVYLLLGASAVAFIMGDTVEGVAVIIAILIAVLSGFISEFRAHKSVESLRNMVKTNAKVRRDSKLREINSDEVVVGDMMYLEEGDPVTADARIISNKNLATIESPLTGESEAIDKDHEFIGQEDTPVGDRKNMVFTGTAVTRGNAYAVVTATGMDTQIGKISSLLKEQKKTATPLEEQLDKLGKTLIYIAAGVAFIVTLVGILSGQETFSMIKIGIILAIAAVPEALPAVSTITLALGMKIMAKHNALVKSLPAVETLGSTTVICTDKTGTLTESQMTVKKIYTSKGKTYDVEGTGYNPEGKIYDNKSEVNLSEEAELKKLIISGVLPSNATLNEENGEYTIIGDPTEGGIVVLGEKILITKDTLEGEGYKRIGEIPFSSKERYMATAYEVKGNGKTVFVKGAPDVLVDMSKRSESEKNEWLEINDRLAEEGLRVLGVAQIENYGGDGTEASIREQLEKGINLLGFLAIIDPPREDVKQAIKESQEAGIRTIMITGDHPKTAEIIAKKIGLKNTEEVITGKEMDKMSEKELAERILSVDVFARVSPENKLQIVKALNDDKEVTAMTGDGVNDAPALNGADIGIAMGIRGTEVAKDASDMILTDDKFSTIVQAVKEGRIIFDNIKKFVYFLFSCNIVEILVVFLTILLKLPMPILALQILWLNLVVDVLPAMSLAWESGEQDIMKRKPRAPQQSIMNKPFILQILWNGSLISLGSLIVFIFALNQGYTEVAARTMCFSTMALGQLLHIFNVRGRTIIQMGKAFFKNGILWLALMISLVLQIIAVYLPFFNDVMGTTPLDMRKWFVVILGAAVPMIVIQILRGIGIKKATHIEQV
ncbi:MAG: cation-translocating P-type ATPase [Thermotogota bacterium]